MQMSVLSEKIRDARERSGMAQSDLATIVGVSRNAVSQWENGANSPSLDKLLKVCGALGISPDSLIDGPIRVGTGNLSVKGEVRAGAWLEANPRYSHAKQFALRIVGTSMNKVVEPGQFVVVADFESAGADLKDGDLVVVHRERSSTPMRLLVVGTFAFATPPALSQWKQDWQRGWWKHPNLTIRCRSFGLFDHQTK